MLATRDDLLPVSHARANSHHCTHITLTAADLGRQSAYMLDSPSKLYDAAPAFPAKLKSAGPARE